MKSVSVILLCALCAYVYARPEQYTTKYDNIDLDQILRSNRLLTNYINCLLNKGICTKDGETLKQLLPDALKTNCEKCSDKQKEGTKKVISHLIKNKKEMWAELEAMYDPDGVYRKKYESDLKAGTQ